MYITSHIHLSHTTEISKLDKYKYTRGQNNLNSQVYLQQLHCIVTYHLHILDFSSCLNTIIKDTDLLYIIYLRKQLNVPFHLCSKLQLSLTLYNTHLLFTLSMLTILLCNFQI